MGRKVAALFFVLAVGCGDRDVEEGDRLAAEHRWIEAVRAYERAIERYPHNYRAAWGITRIYCLETGHADKCLAWAERLLEAYPRNADYRRAAAAGWRLKAEAAEARGDLEERDRALSRARELD